MPTDISGSSEGNPSSCVAEFQSLRCLVLSSAFSQIFSKNACDSSGKNWVSPGFVWERMIQYEIINQHWIPLKAGLNPLDCANLTSTFVQTGSELLARHKTWSEAKALSAGFHCHHLAVHHCVSACGISIAVINVGSLQPAICSGDKMSYIIASKCCDLEMILPCIFLKACEKQSGNLTLQGTSLSLWFLFCSFRSLQNLVQF